MAIAIFSSVFSVTVSDSNEYGDGSVIIKAEQGGGRISLSKANAMQLKHILQFVIEHVL